MREAGHIYRGGEGRGGGIGNNETADTAGFAQHEASTPSLPTSGPIHHLPPPIDPDRLIVRGWNRSRNVLERAIWGQSPYDGSRKTLCPVPRPIDSSPLRLLSLSLYIYICISLFVRFKFNLA